MGKSNKKTLERWLLREAELQRRQLRWGQLRNEPEVHGGKK